MRRSQGVTRIEKADDDVTLVAAVLVPVDMATRRGDCNEEGRQQSYYSGTIIVEKVCNGEDILWSDVWLDSSTIMVGLFSRFSVSRNAHRRSQSALDEREVVAPDTVSAESTSVTGVMSTSHHGIEVAVEFKPVEHPTEPLDTDQPIQCPLPEPSILNDGRIWKERVSAGVQRRDLPVMQEEAGGPPGPETPRTKSRPRTNRMILPSISAPEHNILKLLEESGM
ncbi:hypothetical protein QVD17_26901 [Tagetes erecta]|uniref:Uncharacterized protein n=1 Tax=Tagetes erecta TaxID=13708 RepID=A0AAD8NQR2_TARER|nr:hypothetical protein QVD17_26901 [Tagetes erecta]